MARGATEAAAQKMLAHPDTRSHHRIADGLFPSTKRASRVLIVDAELAVRPEEAAAEDLSHRSAPIASSVEVAARLRFLDPRAAGLANRPECWTDK